METRELSDEMEAQVSLNGEGVRLHLKDRQGMPFGIDLLVGQIPKLIGRLMRGADQASKVRKELDPTADSANEILPVLAHVPRSIKVGTAFDGSSVGLTITFSGVPFTAALTEQQARDVAEHLTLSADQLAEHRQAKPN